MSTEAYCVVMTTCATNEEADLLIGRLLDEQLAACIQVVDIKSSYVWKGARSVDPEKLLLIKTRSDRYDAVQERLLAIHPYETPEIIRVPVVDGAPAYLAWVDDSVGARVQSG